jgi:hypothetical protein
LLSEQGAYVERALELGFAYDRRGEASAAMGIDVDRDLNTNEFRVVVGNFYEEMTSLYVNAKGASSFIDESVAEGIGPRANTRTTFGALFVDYDNDGYRDIFEVNGAIQEITGSPAISSGIALVDAKPLTFTWGSYRAILLSPS